MKRIASFFIVCMLFAVSLAAQDKESLRNYESRIMAQMELVYGASTDDERLHASEAASHLFEEALALENSFKWKWNLGDKASVLTSPDKRFRIITWPVVRNNGEWKCFGFVQSYDDEEEEYVVYALHDKSDEIIGREESVLGPSQWLGSVYQELIQTSYEGQNFYTLLGWCGVDNLTQRKVVEPVYFKKDSSQPIFGQPIFRRQRNMRRMVLQYTNTAMVNLRYEVQYTRTVTTTRVKKKGSKRPVVVKENHDTREKMIIFDEVAPRLPGMEGLYHYYVPTGKEMALVFVDGKWELRDNAQGRVPDNRLNKAFEPLSKDIPEYKYIDQSELPN